MCGGVLAWVVWDRSERELADRAGREEHERPRFLPFGGGETELPDPGEIVYVSGGEVFAVTTCLPA